MKNFIYSKSISPQTFCFGCGMKIDKYELFCEYCRIN